MTHKELWLTTAEALGTPRRERTANQVRLTNYGLCHIINKLTSKWPSGFAEAFTPSSLRPRYDTWWPEHCQWPRWKPQHDTQRCLFACFMAAIGKREYDAMIKEAQDEG